MFAIRPLSSLIRWYNKTGYTTKEFWEKAIQFSCACNFIKKETLPQVFSVNLAKFLRTSFLQNTSRRLLLGYGGSVFFVLSRWSKPSSKSAVRKQQQKLLNIFKTDIKKAEWHLWHLSAAFLTPALCCHSEVNVTII